MALGIASLQSMAFTARSNVGMENVLLTS